MLHQANLLKKLLSSTLFAGLSAAAAEEVQHLGFYSTSNVAICELSAPGSSFPSFPGKASEQFIGTVCEVTVPHSTFSKHFRFCAVSYVESYARGPQSCGVKHFPKYVIFTYSYSKESKAPPLCEFACISR